MSAAPDFTIGARLQAMLDVEGALADAEASLDIIPRSAPASIRGACRAAFYDAAVIETEARRAGNLAIPLVRQLTRRVAETDGEAAKYVHWGATSQDIIDTALVLQLRDAVPGIAADLARAADAAAGHARRFAGTPMAGRTWLQQATPVTFGLKAAGWVDALDRVAHGVRRALDGALVVQFGGASGTLAALGDRGAAVAGRIAAALGLDTPSLPWHAHRDRLAALSCALGVATGTAGKIARDIALLAQTEIGEAHEGTTDGGGSSTMPHKQNPVNSAIALAAAVRAPGLVATVLAAMPQEHERALGGWQAEWEAIPQLVVVSAQAAAAIAESLERLVVDPARMRANLDASGGLILAEAIVMRLAASLGKHEAHTLVERAARRATTEGRAFADALADEPQIAAILDRRAIDATLLPENYLGSAPAFIANVLARHPKA
jgi:3-carboxy-cis,cis-muconate cycloisomerase